MHLQQMDAFFGNGTGWGAEEPESEPPCSWSGPFPNTYLAGCAAGEPPTCISFPTLDEAKVACATDTYPTCAGVTTRSTGMVELRAGTSPISVPDEDNETSYLIENLAACKNTTLPPDPVWLARGRAAYGAVAKADGPTARWIYQG